MLAAVAKVLGHLPADTAGTPFLDIESDDRAHDEYFHVARTGDHEPPVLLRSALLARWIFLTDIVESPTSLPDSQLAVIDRGLAAYVVSLRDAGGAEVPVVGDWQPAGGLPQPMTRWIRGHQVFAVLTQGLIFSFQCMARALREGRDAHVRHWADLSTTLLRASAATFRFTGDLPPDDYDRVIRPSMSPPHAPICLSGLMSWDHRFLAQTMRDMRPALKALGERDSARHEAIAAAIAEVYDSHIHVCERFVGDQPSLLTAGRTEQPGPVLLENFKALRLKPFVQTASPRRCPIDAEAAVTTRPSASSKSES